ncbi:hypothetical protein [Acrocarpospora catenulata]|uniref:hypothetical protein n=1 Tax=Acrocarpospora catenulata TaxID=2836182 RepID=UPI001BD93556|nr:hypothetical protein [Acrocarpospora catenulata]
MGNPYDPTQPPPGSYGQQLPPYDPNAPLPPQQPQPGYQYAPPPPQYGQPYGQKPPSGAPTMSIIAFILGVLALLFVPIVLGPIGIALGIVGHRRGEKLGVPAAITAGVCMVLGMIIGAVVYSNM